MSNKKSHLESKEFAPRGRKNRTMAEAEKANKPKKTGFALQVEVSAAINRKREGKTLRDHKSGAWRKRLENQTVRGNWSRARTEQTANNFPAHTLGGKGRSSLPFKMCGGRGRTQDHRPVGGNPTFKRKEQE